MDHSSFSLDTVLTFGVAFGATSLLIILLRRLAWFTHLRTRKEGERTTTSPLYFRLGGVALFGGFVAAFNFDERLVLDASLQVLIIGVTIAFLFGLMDDLRPLHWMLQLGVQLGLGILLFSAGMTLERIHLGSGQFIDFTVLPGLEAMVTLGWVLLVMNAINWVDGVDGLMGGVMSIAFFTLFILSLQPDVNQPTLALLSLMLFGALTAFTFFNWFPAKILAGTSGVAFLGFMLAALSLYAGAKVATALLVLVVPILDTVAVIIGRLLRGRSPFLPDKKHLHHVLLDLSWTPREVTFLYTFVTSLMALLALSTRLTEKVVVFGVVTVFFVGGVLWTRWLLSKRDTLYPLP